MKRNFMFLTTFLIQLIVAAEMAIIGPLSPFLALYFSIDESMVILLSLGYSAVGFLVPYLGVFGDKFGKKRSISISLTFFILGSIIGALAKSAFIFGFARIFIGFAYFSLSATNLSYLSEFISYENRGKASGILRFAFSISILLSPIVSTYLVDKFNNLAVIYIPLAIVAFVALIFLRQLPETKKYPNIVVNKSEFLSLLKNPVAKKMLISVFLILTAPTLILNYLGIYLTNSFNVSQVHIGTIYTIAAIGTVLGTFFSGVFSDKIGKYKLAKILFIVMLIAIIPIPYVKNLIMIILLTILFSFGMDGGWTSYQAFGSEVIPEKRGTFMSLMYTVNAITITFYSLVGPILYRFGGFPFLIIIASIFVAIAIFIIANLNVKD
ncbi:MAG TPA: MFS transporter [Tissierellaceae bacterium]|nr:MFS transporter [Tissierellaceae bacterium]